MTLIVEFPEKTILQHGESFDTVLDKLIETIIEKAEAPIVKGYQQSRTRKSKNDTEMRVYSVEFIDGESEENIFSNLTGLNVFSWLKVMYPYLKQDIVITLNDTVEVKEVKEVKKQLEISKFILNDNDILNYIKSIERIVGIEIKKKDDIKVYTSQNQKYFYLDIKNLKNLEKLEEKLKDLEKYPKVLDLRQQDFIPYTSKPQNNSNITELRRPNWQPTSNSTSVDSVKNDVTKLKLPIKNATDKWKATETPSDNHDRSILRFKDRDDAIEHATESDYIEITDILMSFMAAACHTLSIGFQKDFDNVNPESGKDSTSSEEKSKQASDVQSEQSPNTTADRHNQSNIIDIKEPNVNQLPDAEIKSESESDQSEDKSFNVDDVSTSVKDTIDQKIGLSENQALSDCQENTNEETTNSQDNQ